MIPFAVFAVAVVVAGIACYVIGYRACEDKWRDGMTENVTKMVESKLSEIRGLYDETYRNVLRHLVEIIKEEKENGQK